MGHKDIKHRVKARLVRYRDVSTSEIYEFVTNNLKMSASTIAALYRKRWQIESLFKRMKQNYPLKYFLGDSENAIKIQIWCALIADLLLKIVKKAAAAKWSFSNLAAMVRLHLMTYINLFSFLKSPEKSLRQLFSRSVTPNYNQLSFIT
jgi:IS4 transposase